MYLYDYHMHSTNSTDGHNSIREMGEVAISKGLSEIAVTDHFEPNEKNERYLEYNPNAHYKEVCEADSFFNNKLKVKFGIELGQPHLFPKHSTKIVQSYDYDFVLASAHKMRSGIDFGEIDYTGDKSEYFCRLYIDQLRKIADYEYFDCVGHLDLPKRYAARQGTSVDLMDYSDELEKALSKLITKGKGIEINTSGVRQETRNCLPDYPILKLYKKLGGEIVTVGSDAHYAEHVGCDIESGIHAAKSAGFKYMTIYTKRRPEWIKIESSSMFYIEKQVRPA